MKILSYRDLFVWQKALSLCVDLYRATGAFPGDERFGLTAEIRKTARSVVCNVAEGHRRGSTRDYIRCLGIARGSGAELETQIVLAGALGYLEERPLNAFVARVDEVERMLVALIHSLEKRVEASRSRPDP